MNCSEFLDHFSDYIDGDPSVVSRAERHLQECQECRRYVEVFDRGRALLKAFPGVEVCEAFEPELQVRIGVAKARAGFVDASSSSTTAVTAFGMAVLLVLAAWSPRAMGTPTPVDLAPIVVSNPAPRPLGVRHRPVEPFRSQERELSSIRAVERSEPNDLLFRYSPLANRAGYAALRSGLD